MNRNAHIPSSGANPTSFVSASDNRPEFTFVPVLLGVVLGIIFGASSLYLALKVGMTVSASIPVAVLSITVLRYCSKLFGVRQPTILENNIVQTTGSAGESIAFGVAVTMPALMILGYEMELSRIMIVAILGGILGVLMMIPLRRALIAGNDKTLVYPEGKACAQVLIAGEQGGTSARTVFTGFFLGLIHKIFGEGLRLWPTSPEKTFSFFKGATIASDMAPELMGVGYIIGPRIASITVAGGILSWFVFIPAIKLFGGGLTQPLFPATKLISEMGPFEIWKAYVLYIGAGAVAGGGLISLLRSLPTIVRGAKSGLENLRDTGTQTAKALNKLRTDHDLPLSLVVGGSAALVLAIWFIPVMHMNLLGALLIVLFGFLFVLVSSRLTGEIGSSSNPISGMTVATLLFTSLVFLALGWTSPVYRVTALTVAAIVCIASSNAGTTSQDLKTGHIVGATPRYQQIALLIGTLTSAVVIGYTLELLNDAKTIYAKRSYPQVVFTDTDLTEKRQTLHGPEALQDQGEYRVLQLREPHGEIPSGKYLVDDEGHIKYLVDPGINGALKERDDGTKVEKYETPKARLMSLIIDGILTQKLPWGLVLLGLSIVLVLELCGIPSLAFAVGVYLPISSSMPIFIGGAVRWLVEAADRRRQRKAGMEEEHDSAEDASPGVLLSSGLIAGASIAGVSLAFANFKPALVKALDLSGSVPALAGSNEFALIVFGALALFVYLVGRGTILKEK